MKEKFNIKNSIYLNMSLENDIVEIAEENNCNYQKTIRYISNKAVKQYKETRS